MTARRTLAAGLLALTVSTACVPGEMGDMFDFALDWALSDDPGLQAASQAHEEMVNDTLARQNFEQGIETVDAVAFEQAATLRPAEPRYAVYAAAVHAANGEFDEANKNSQRAIEALEKLYPEASQQEIQRRWAELHLEASRDLILNSGTDRLDAELREGYCVNLTNNYRVLFGDSVDGVLYLATADYSLCE